MPSTALKYFNGVQSATQTKASIKTIQSTFIKFPDSFLSARIVIPLSCQPEKIPRVLDGV